MFLPHFYVFCDLLLNRRTATWNLFVLYNKEINYYRKCFFISKSFNITQPLLTLVNTKKKAIWRDLLSIQNEAISLVAMCSKELWLVQKNHATVTLEYHGMKLKTYSESRVELWNLQILKKMLEKSSQVKFFVIRSALWAKKLGRCLEYCRSLKNTLGKLAVVVNTGGLSRSYEWKEH